MLQAGSAFACMGGARMVGQNPAHYGRRESIEMSAIVPIRFALLKQPKVELMHQRRRLEGVVSSFAAKICAGHLVQVRIHMRHELVACLRVARSPFSEQNGYV